MDLGGGLPAARTARRRSTPSSRPGRPCCSAPTPSFELGASLGIPFLTAHRCLTVAESLPDRIGPGTLTGRTVLVQGGAGAVGNAAIQLARWADATVITTVSGPDKAQLAAAAGADHVINYRRRTSSPRCGRSPRTASTRSSRSPPRANAAHRRPGHRRCTAPSRCTPTTAATSVTIPVRSQMRPERPLAVRAGLHRAARGPRSSRVEDVNAAVLDGAVRVGEEAGLPLHVFPLAETAAAHQAVQDGAVGKVLIDVTA